MRKKIQLFISIIILIGLNTIIHAQVNLDSGLVANFPFNGDADDISIYNNHGTVNGATLTDDRFGNPNSAYSFDGLDDYIDSDFNFNGIQSNFSFSYWFNFNIKDGKIFHMQENLTDNPEINNDFNSDSLLDFYLRGTDPGNGSEEGCSLYSGTINTETWYHAVCTYDFISQTKKMYLNSDIIILTTSILNIDRLPISSLRIGGSRNDVKFFNGIIDDFRIYNRILNEDEIDYLFTTSINDVLFNNSIEIYPNPAINYITIEIDNAYTSYYIEILNMTGKIIFHKEIRTKREKINMSNFDNGVYFIRIRNKDFIKTEKLIKY